MQNRNAAAEAVCPLRHLADVFGGKWKLPIMCILAGDAPVRYSAIRRRLDGVTNVMLTQSLRELESYGLVERRSSARCRRAWSTRSPREDAAPCRF